MNDQRPPARTNAHPDHPRPDDPSVYEVYVRHSHIKRAIERVNATLHLSPRGQVDDRIRYDAAVLLAEFWAAVDSCGIERDLLTVVGGRMASVALDVVQLADAEHGELGSVADTMRAIRARRYADTPWKFPSKLGGTSPGKGSTTGNATGTTP